MVDCFGFESDKVTVFYVNVGIMNIETSKKGTIFPIMWGIEDNLAAEKELDYSPQK